MHKATRILVVAGLIAGVGWFAGGAVAGRFGGGGGRGGGGFGGGGARPGGFGGGAPMSRPSYQPSAARPAASQSGTVHGPYGGTMTGGRQTGTVAGPGGGAGVAGRQGGAYTGPRGGQAVGGSRGGAYTTAGGTAVSGGSKGGVYTGPRGQVTVAGGAKGGTVTGPGGNTVSGGKGGAVVIGPNGNVHATGGKGAVATGPGGTAAAGARGSVTTGPGGTVATGSRGAVATGPGGTVAGGSRGAVAVGPNGAVAAGGRGVAATGPGGAYVGGTRFVAASDLHGQGAYVRNGFHYYNAFTPGWYARYPGAWAAAGWAAGAAWAAPAWGTCATAVGYPADTTAYTYDYGDNITYQDGNVYFGDQVAATEAQYADQATQIADAGRQAQPAADEQWQPLGVFALVKGDETTSDNIFQLALDKGGVVRGNYYNALTDSTQPVYGSLDKKSQRVAWSVGEKKDVVFEAGLLNLTKEQTTVLVHLGKDRTEQYALFRIEQPKDQTQPPP
jgi:hypothetical protein